MNVPPLNTLSPPASAPFPPQAPPCSALPAHPHLGQCPCPCCRAVSSLALRDTTQLEGMTYCSNKLLIVKSGCCKKFIVY